MWSRIFAISSSSHDAFLSLCRCLVVNCFVFRPHYLLLLYVVGKWYKRGELEKKKRQRLDSACVSPHNDDDDGGGAVAGDHNVKFVLDYQFHQEPRQGSSVGKEVGGGDK